MDESARPRSRRRGRGRGHRRRDADGEHVEGGGRARAAVGFHAHLERRLQRCVRHRHRPEPVEVRHRSWQQLRDRRDRDDDQQHVERVLRRPGSSRPPGQPLRLRPAQRLDVRARGDPGGDLRRPGRRRRAHGVRPPAAQRHHRQRRRLLAGVLDARLDPARRRDLAEVRRDRRHGGHQRPQLRLQHHPLRREPGRTVQRVDRHRLRRARVFRLPDRLPRLRGGDRPLGLARAGPVLPRREQLLHRLRQPGGRADLDRRDRPPVLHHLRPGDGRRLPRRVRRRPQLGHGLRRQARHRLGGRLQQGPGLRGRRRWLGDRPDHHRSRRQVRGRRG